ncbi:MAG TPA: FmdB family zinc ribbon protein [Capillibacterium sp.]
MPTYDYECSQCGHFEWVQRITEDPLTVCPHCGGKVYRQISRNGSIIFKGSGFYVTDNRKTGNQKEGGNVSSLSDKKVS